MTDSSSHPNVVKSDISTDLKSSKGTPQRGCSTLIALLRQRATHQGDRLAYAFFQDGETETGRIDYKTLDLRAKEIAAHLTRQNKSVIGSRVLLVYPPGLSFIAAFFGCLYAGAIAVPAYPPRRNQNMSRLQAIVESSQATMALTTATALASITKYFPTDPALANLHWLATDTLSHTPATDWSSPPITPQSLAFIQYTSGSTGVPKGVMISHRNIMHNLGLIQQCFGDTPESLGVSWLPPYHDMGLVGGILEPLYVGAPMLLMPPIAFLQKPLRWLQLISRFQATTSGGPNFAFDLCVQRIKPEQLQTLDLSRWKVAFTGAEPVRANTLQKFSQKFSHSGFVESAFLPCYGMAETTLMVSSSKRDTAPVTLTIDTAALENNQILKSPSAKSSASSSDRADTQTIVGCGQSVEALQVMIVNPESLAQCAANQVGEVWVAGESVAKGYWNQRSLTTQTFYAHLSNSGKGPFLRTGDLGFLSEGELFITGRIKDLMIIRGQNHYPQDIELTVQNSHPALRPAAGAAFTVEIKGEERLVIVQEVERSYLRKLDAEDVVGSIRQAVSAHHGLQIYATVLIKTGSIPKTSSGKIQRHACRSQFLAKALNVVQDWSENPQGKVRFVALKAEVDSLLQQLS